MLFIAMLAKAFMMLYIQRILLRDNIHVKLESWRSRKVPDGYYADVYDGKVWKSFMDKLFRHKRSLAFMINVDWFQPFKHCTDSLGAIYLTIVNFPRKERYKRENIILIGLMPSLETEPSCLNTFLSPLVTELQTLWEGLRMYTSDSPKYKVLIRGAIICAACDIPAARKLCGFKGHNGNRGCSKCFKLFSGTVTKRDYSGFDRTCWPPRSITLQRTISKKIKDAKTAVQRSKLEIEYGIYYSILTELEYFNGIIHTIIDPMHNLFLGTAKRFFKKICIPRGLLQEKELKQIQARVDSMIVPSTIGRIPKKIATAFGGFTAEQWMNWTTVYSLYALRGLLPEEDYRCWESFVLACRLLSAPVLTSIDIKKADLLLLSFCKKVEILYGKNEITPNMHLHCHLSECIEDYGPIFGFWLFSFERYNGMLGNFPNNQKHIEVQLMRRFEIEMQLYALPLPLSLKETFIDLLKSGTFHPNENQVIQGNFAYYYLSNCSFREGAMLLFQNDDTWKFPSRWTVRFLSTSELIAISQVLRHLFTAPSFIPDIESLPTSLRCYKRIEFRSEVFSIYNDSRYGRHSHILASWAGENGDIDISGLRPGRIELIFRYRFAAGDGVARSLPIAKVEWYKGHPQKDMFGTGLELWSKNTFEDFGPASYIPIHCINSKFAPAYGSINVTAQAASTTAFESVLFVCPLRSNNFL